MTVVDVGANVGYYTFLAAACTGPGGQVYAVEPSPYAYARLEKSIARNSLHQVKAFRIGLGVQPGKFNLYMPPSSYHNHSPTMNDIGWEPVVVDVKTLDECLDEWGVDQVDLLKVDVEGFESQLFAGAKISLQTGRIKAIVCEFNDEFLRLAGSSAEELFNTLQTAGFRDSRCLPRAPWEHGQNLFMINENNSKQDAVAGR